MKIFHMNGSSVEITDINLSSGLLPEGRESRIVASQWWLHSQ